MWFKELVEQCESDTMRIWTIYANTHATWVVDDLTPLVVGLLAASTTFYGPVSGADGVRARALRHLSHTQGARAITGRERSSMEAHRARALTRLASRHLRLCALSHVLAADR